MKGDTMNLGNRITRLERLTETDAPDTGKVPPQFWGALCGLVAWEQLTPETRRLIASVSSMRSAPCPIEAKIAAVGLPAIALADRSSGSALAHV
jgi:hypothetical protein